MSQRSPQIDYAPKPPPHLRWQRRAVISFAAILVIGLAYQYIPVAWRNARLFYWQKKCLKFMAPADELIFDGNLNDMSGHATPFEDFYRIYSPPGSSANYVAFLHERLSPNGIHKLVVVEATPYSGGHEVNLRGRCFELGSLVSPPTEGGLFLSSAGGNEFPAPIHAGQIDPADSSHFTIECGGGMIVDGWVKDNNNVLFEPRQRTTNGLSQ